MLIIDKWVNQLQMIESFGAFREFGIYHANNNNNKKNNHFSNIR